MAEKKQFPTLAMLKAREKLANMTPEEREAGRQSMKEELKKYYSRRPKASVTRDLRGDE